MSILTNRTFEKDVIELEDGLFLIPTTKELQSFYNDLNYYYKSNIFVNDEFKIIRIIKNCIEHITQKVNNIDLTKKIYNIYKDDKKISYTINKKKDIYIKLDLHLNNFIVKKLYDEYNGDKNMIDDYILCGIIRYATLGSGANQFVVDLEYKELLRKETGLNFECFGSMFNHYYKYYCSMFYDIEKYFGSCGSFFSVKTKKGIFMANPPYDDTLLNKM
jgi:hypothetical protein